MKFISEVSLPSPNENWTHNDKIVTLGSCFAEEIGKRISHALFPILSNPFATLFSPLAIAQALARVLNKDYFTEEAFFCHEELWRHFDLHSQFASTRLEESIRRANACIDKTHTALLQCNHLIITFGTAWCYFHMNSQKFVSHNHRLPKDQFTKELLQPERITKLFLETLSKLKTLNPNLSILFTVSPVRYLREGLYENNLSKAALHLSIHNLLKQTDNAAYFPAYEIVNDELRDYRFFKDDLAHPTSTAIDYVWEKFSETYFAENTKLLCCEIESIRKARAHTPQNPNTEAHKKFLESIRERIQILDTKGINVSRLVESPAFQ